LLGEFEYLLISAASRLGDSAYGVSIAGKIEDATGRACSLGALYTTIDRLEDKGFLTTWMGEATAQRGGRPKRMVRVTARGRPGSGGVLRGGAPRESRFVSRGPADRFQICSVKSVSVRKRPPVVITVL
jgi:hypothetical protein